MRSGKRSFAPWSALVLLLALLSKRGLVKRGAELTRASDALCKAPLVFAEALNSTVSRCAARPKPKQRRRAASPLLRRWDAAAACTARRRAPRVAPGRRASPRTAPSCGSRRVTKPPRATPRHSCAPPGATLVLNATTRRHVLQLANNRELGSHHEHPDQEEAARRRRQLGVLCHLPQLVEGRKGAAQGLCQGPLLPQGRRRERGRRRRRDRGHLPLAALGCVEIKSGASRHRRDITTSSARWRGDSTSSMRPISLFDFHTGTRKASTRSCRSSLSTYGRSGRRRPQKSWRRRATARRRTTPSSRPSSTSRTRACSGG